MAEHVAQLPGFVERPPRPRSVAPRPGRRWLQVLLAVFAAAALAGLALWLARRAPRPAPVRFETAATQRGPVRASVNANGTLSALVTVQVGSQASGRIETLRVDYNSPVVKGQTIATIEPSTFRAALSRSRANVAVARAEVSRARAQIDLAERRLGRARGLMAEGLLSRADLDSAEAEAEVAHAAEAGALATLARAGAELEQATLDLAHTTIVSPIDGIVVARNVDVGQTVAATLQAPTLFTIAQDLAAMQVDTSVAEADVGKIVAGMPVTFTVDAFPGRVFEGRVRQVRNAAQTIQNVVTYDAVVDVDNSDHLLRPGMTADVIFVHAEKPDALLVSNAGLRFRPDAHTATALGEDAMTSPRTLLRGDQRELWVLRDKRARRIVVRVGLSDGKSTEVLEGDVREGDAVITEAVSTQP